MQDFFLGGEGRLQPEDAAVALITVDGAGYLMQLRDQKGGIFYPGHWGTFGGAVEPGEAIEQALSRELMEELALTPKTVEYFTEIGIDFSFAGLKRIARRYYLTDIAAGQVDDLKLGEGSDMRIFTAAEILAQPRVVPYDAFAIWLHSSRTMLSGADTT